MERSDSVVSGWLDGIDSVDGIANPAGPLYIEGLAATEAALTDVKTPISGAGTIGTTGTSCSFTGGCCCC
jgi:hypothetical protein